MMLPILIYLFLALAHPTIPSHSLDLRLTPHLTFRSSVTRTATLVDPANPTGHMICIGGTACSRHNPTPLHMAECSNINIRTSDPRQRPTPIGWACSAPVPPGVFVSSWTVRCLSAHPENRTLTSTESMVIRGSCRLEYQLNLTPTSSTDRSVKSPSPLSSSPSSMGTENRNTTSPFATMHSKHYGARFLAATLTCTILSLWLITLHRHCCVNPPSPPPRRPILVSRRYHYEAILNRPPSGPLPARGYVIYLPKTY